MARRNRFEEESAAPAPPKQYDSRILVIKLGALGDFIQALGPFAAIRDHHPNAHLTLLTTAPYADLGESCGLFEDVWVDERPRAIDVLGWWKLRRKMRGGHFNRVYDLQTSDRSGYYYRLFPRRRRPEWSGIVKGCSHPHANPRRDFMHTVDRQAEQLAQAGIPRTPLPDLSWMDADISHLGINPPYVLFVPGGSLHRPEKRWPADFYAELAHRLLLKGLTPLILGTGEEEGIAQIILNRAYQARNLIGRTSFEELAALGRSARGAVGNDTGPMHIIAGVGCPSLVLYSADSDPALCIPAGVRVGALRRNNLENLTVDTVEAALLLREQ